MLLPYQRGPGASGSGVRNLPVFLKQTLRPRATSICPVFPLSPSSSPRPQARRSVLMSHSFPTRRAPSVTSPSPSLHTGAAPGGTVPEHSTYAALCPTRSQQRGHRHELRGALPGQPAASGHHEADADRAESPAARDRAAEAAVPKRAEAATAADPSRAGTVSVCLRFCSCCEMASTADSAAQPFLSPSAVFSLISQISFLLCFITQTVQAVMLASGRGWELQAEVGEQ